MSNDSPRERFHALIQSAMTELSKELPHCRGVLTGFVVVAEMLNDEDQPGLFVVDSKQAEWRTIGLLEGAKTAVWRGSSTPEEE